MLIATKIFLFGIFIEMFCTNLQSPVWIHHIGVQYFCGAPMWRPENNVNMWTLLVLKSPGPLIICTGQRNVYINTFPATLTSQMTKNHTINVYYFFDNTIVTVCHALP